MKKLNSICLCYCLIDESNIVFIGALSRIYFRQICRMAQKRRKKYGRQKNLCRLGSNAEKDVKMEGRKRSRDRDSGRMVGGLCEKTCHDAGA